MMKMATIEEFEFERASIGSPKNTIRESRKIEEMKTPLDTFSLEKSRNLRLRLQ